MACLALRPTVRLVERYGIAEAAERTGLGIEELSRLVELGILKSNTEGRFATGDVRRAGLVSRLAAAGTPSRVGRRHQERAGLARLPR